MCTKVRGQRKTIGTMFFRVLHSFHFVEVHISFSFVLPHRALMSLSHHMNNDFAFLTTKQAAALSCVPCAVGILIFRTRFFFCSISFSVFSFFFLCNTCFSLGAYSFCQALSFLRRSLLISMWQFGCLFIIVSLSLFVFLLCISEHHILSKTPSDFSSRIVSFLLIYKYSLYLLHQKYKDFNAADIFSECSCTSLAYFYCFVSIQSLMSNTL